MSRNLDALVVLEEVAVSLKESAEQVDSVSAFDEGRLAGYYEALSTLLSQCRIAGIDPGEIGLAGFNPESLLRLRKAA
ncbi:MAG: hypothetical protein EPN21_08595 [Methylococcaceae bacterium]|nr:MAG: hypothetical protein EPN21_08595 [Methylococcaceae bacterium]